MGVFQVFKKSWYLSVFWHILTSQRLFWLLWASQRRAWLVWVKKLVFSSKMIGKAMGNFALFKKSWYLTVFWLLLASQSLFWLFLASQRRFWLGWLKKRVFSSKMIGKAMGNFALFKKSWYLTVFWHVLASRSLFWLFLASQRRSGLDFWWFWPPGGCFGPILAVFEGPGRVWPKIG